MLTLISSILWIMLAVLFVVVIFKAAIGVAVVVIEFLPVLIFLLGIAILVLLL